MKRTDIWQRRLRHDKKLISMITCILLFLSMTWDASASSLLYVGGEYTDDGGNLFVRVEDGNLNDENKLYVVSQAGKYREGEVYHGLFGYTWTFTHDSYRYISRRDGDQVDLGSDYEYTYDEMLFEQAGTNEYGLTVTATQSLDAAPAVEEADPYIYEGLSENEITTILLSECKTAREAVDLLRRTVEADGQHSEGFGVMICDQKEQWYAEAVTSHYFLAVPLPRDVVFFQANVSMFGLIDLDDETIVASEGIIELAQRAGTFVGDAEKNIIDWRRSLNDYNVQFFRGDWAWNVFERTSLTLNWLEGTSEWNTDNVRETSNYIMTNIGEDGSIVPLHNSVQVARTVSLDNLLELLTYYPLGYSENIETHLYRFYPDEDPVLGIVEWSSMDNNQFNVFVPDYPVLMTDTWKGYQVSLPVVKLLTKDLESWEGFIEEELGALSEAGKLEGEKPDTKDAYEMKGVHYALYFFKDYTDLWHVFQDGWEKSYCATFSALSNYLTYMDLGEEAVALTKKCFAEMQQDFKTRFEALSVQLREETDLTLRQEIATRETSRMAEEAHELARALYRHFVYGDELLERWS